MQMCRGGRNARCALQTLEVDAAPQKRRARTWAAIKGNIGERLLCFFLAFTR